MLCQLPPFPDLELLPFPEDLTLVHIKPEWLALPDVELDLLDADLICLCGRCGCRTKPENRRISQA